LPFTDRPENIPPSQKILLKTRNVFKKDKRRRIKKKEENITQARLTYDHPNGFTYLQLGRDFINLFLFKYMAF